MQVLFRVQHHHASQHNEEANPGRPSTKDKQTNKHQTHPLKITYSASAPPAAAARTRHHVALTGPRPNVHAEGGLETLACRQREFFVLGVWVKGGQFAPCMRNM